MCLTWRLRMRRLEWRPSPGVWLGLAVLLCYANALGGVFQFDDYKVIVDNPAVHTWDAWWGHNGQGLLGIRPLLKLSYLLSWTTGAGALGFLAMNITLHGVNVWLVYRLSQTVLAWLAPREPWADVPFWTALVFAVHPAQTEAVTYICGRSSALMTLFYLAAILLYAWAARQRESHWAFLLGVPVLFLLALFVKETAITLPLALLMLEWLAGTRAGCIWQRQRLLWCLLLLSVGYVLFNSAYLAHLQRSAELNSLAGNLATQAVALAYLLRQWVLPFWLNIDPDLPVLASLLDAGPLSLLPLLVLWAAWRSRHAQPWVSFALFWFVLQVLALHVLLPRLDVANDRQLYLASWPLAMAAVMWVRVQLRPRLALSVLASAVALLAVLTLARNQDYRTEVALWQDTVKRSPGKARVHNNLGYAYHLSGQDDAARAAYLAALRLDPQHIKARFNLRRLDQPQ